MRRFSISLVAAATTATAFVYPVSAENRILSVSKQPRTVALPKTQRAPASRSVYRHPVYTTGRVHPGFYNNFGSFNGGFGNFNGGFGNFGNVLPGGGANTDVNVDVRTQGGNAVAAPVVVSPGNEGVAEEMRALRTENWELRRSMSTGLDALGAAASGDGEGSAELRELLGAIVARRERQYQERTAGNRVVAVEAFQRELGEARSAVRRLENRPRNKHVLYLGFDD